MPSRSARWLLILIACAVCIVSWLGASFYSFDAKRVAFDRSQWVQGRAGLKLTADPGCVLGGMALDLQKTNRLIQMPYQQLFDLIGAPDGSGEKVFLWDVGQCHGGGWDHSHFKIILDTSGRVIEVDFQKATF